MLAVPPGLGHCGYPICGAELAVDPARLHPFLLSTAATPLVSVCLLQVYRALEVLKFSASMEKVYFTPQSMSVGTHHPQPMKMDFLPPELSKTGQITPFE
jgi:hypothetical protein